MSIYRNVHINFWQDAFILNLTAEEKYFYIYLLTNLKTKQYKIYELPSRIIKDKGKCNKAYINGIFNQWIDKYLYSKPTTEQLEQVRKLLEGV